MKRSKNPLQLWRYGASALIDRQLHLLDPPSAKIKSRTTDDDKQVIQERGIALSTPFFRRFSIKATKHVESTNE